MYQVEGGTGFVINHHCEIQDNMEKYTPFKLFNSWKNHVSRVQTSVDTWNNRYECVCS